MQSFGLIYTQEWYINLQLWQKDLVRTSLELFAREERMNSSFDDYSFVVFPMAKAYEGFLKQYFYDLGFITRETYLDKRFRIGRGLNPDLNPSRQDEQWVYGRVREACGEETGRLLWNTWLECRNQLFHYYPESLRKLDLHDASVCIQMLAHAMESAIACERRK